MTDDADSALSIEGESIIMATSSSKFVNNSCRARKWVCGCTEHLRSIDSDRKYSGPYIIRLAGDAHLIRCEYCNELFRLHDEPAGTRLLTKRAPKPCEHCENPEAHTHADDVTVIAATA